MSTILQYCFFLGLGVFLVWLSVRSIDAQKWQEIKDALRHARFYLAIPVFGMLVLSHYIRALRWRLLIEPLGYRTDKTNTFLAVMIGYLANMAVPRLGEVLKCTLLARYEKVPADKLVGTIVLERLIDAICLLIVFGLTIITQPGLYARLNSTVFVAKESAGAEQSSGTGQLILLVIAGLIALAILAWMIIKKKNFRDLFRVFRNIGFRIWEGLTTVRHLKKRGQFLLLTLLIWVLYLTSGYIGFLALESTQHYGITEALTVLSAGSIGMIVTPGGIGAYAYIIEKTMEMYGLQQSIAAAFGWLLWIAQTLVILLGGLVSFLILPWYNKRNPRPAPIVSKT